jgi:uncharacterized protein
MALKQWAMNHPVAAYIALTLAWSWAIWSPLFVVAEPGRIFDGPPFVFVIMFAGLLGPALAGVGLTGLLYGRPGLAALGARLRDARAGWWWLALLIIPLTYGLLPLLRWAAGYPVDPVAMLAKIGPALGLGIAAGLMEEPGWRGFLLPHLLRRRSPLVATLLVGLVWGGLWHGYANYFGLGDRGWGFWPLNLLQGLGLLSAWSLILTRVYQHTRGSLLLSILMHASISSSAFITGLSYSSVGDELTWTVIQAALAWIVAGGFWLATRPAVEGWAATSPVGQS